MKQDERHHTSDDIFVGIDLAIRQHQVVILDARGHRLTSFKVLHSRQGVLLQGLGSRARIRWVDLVTRPIRTPCGSAASARPRRPSPSIAPVPCGAHV